MSKPITQPRTLEQLRSGEGTFRLADCEDTRTHYVYRCFDEAGRLLYVGCTRSPGERMSFHGSWFANSAASWVLSRRMASFTVEKFNDKAAAREAERKAIREGMPLLNKQHNPRFRRPKHELPIVPLT